MDPHDASAEAGQADGVAHDHRVILLIDPRFGGVVHGAYEGAEAFDGVDAGRVGQSGGGRGFDPRTVIFRRGGGEFRQRQVGFDLAIETDEETVFGEGFAHDGEVEVPFVENRLGFGLKLGAQDHEHTLLAFAEHHFIGRHMRFPRRHFFKVEAHAEAAFVAHFHGGAGQARSAHVLDRDHGAGCHQLECGFHQALFGERVADLDSRAFLFDGVVKFGGGHGRATNTVAASFGPEVDHRHADTGGGRVEDFVGVREARREGVHEAIAVIGCVEAHFAANGWHAETVAIATDTFDDAVHKLAGLGVVRAAKAERVHRSNRARAHGEDIAQNAADAGGRTLVGFDVGGVVVALHLEDQRLAIADVDHACVLARAANHLWAVGGQGAEPFLRRLIGTMLVPHGRENAHLGVVWLAPEDVDDLGVFLGGEPVAGDKVGRDGWILHGNSPAGAFAPSYKGKCRGGSGFGRLRG